MPELSQLLLGKCSVNMPVAKKWLSSRNVMAATDTHATIKELLETVFPVRSVPSLYNEHLVSLPVSRESVLRRQLEEEIGVRWPPACEDVSPGAGERPPLEDVTKRNTEGVTDDSSLCVITICKL
jgi:hypothetical protein